MTRRWATAPSEARPINSEGEATWSAVAVGYEAGEGFIKLPYKRELPTPLLKALMQARVADYEATGS